MFDFTRVLAGPFATMILRELGARVIKFESLQGDPARNSGPFDRGDSAYFHPVNRGKESVAVDFRCRSDVEAIRGLLPCADCLVENFRPGVMDAIGLGHKDAFGMNARLIYASCSGFGADGPYASRPAYDVVVQAMGGIMGLTGQSGGPPTRVGVSQGDIVAGVYTALAVATGLASRAVSGEGAFIDVSMLEAQLALATHAFGIRAATGVDPPRMGNRHPATAPFDAYATADAHVAIAVVEDTAFIRACDALGMTDVRDDPRFTSRDRRVEHVEQLTEAFTSRMRKMTTSEVVHKLLDANVACGPVLGMGDLMRDPQVRSRGSLVEISDWGSGGLPVPTLPFKFNGRRWAASERAPDLGSLTLERLTQELVGKSRMS